MRDVWLAVYVSAAKLSSASSFARSGPKEKKWSERHSDSKPSSSVHCVMFFHSGQPMPSCASIITPSFIR